MKSLKTVITSLLFAFLVGIVLGWTLHPKNKIESFSSLQDFRYMHIPNLVPNIKGSLSPDLIFVSDTVTRKKLRIDTVYVPKKMPDYVLSSQQHAITTSGSTIRFNYFNPRTRQYQIRQYHFHPSPWHYNIAANAYIFPFESLTLIGLSGNIGYDRLKIAAGAYLGSDLKPYPMIHIHYKLIGKE